MTKSWNKVKKSQRKIKTKERKEFLIRCEGPTEENYFSGFPVNKNELDIKGTGCNTESLIKETIKTSYNLRRQGITFRQMWCVFDKDRYSYEQIKRAFELAKDNHIDIAYSNRNFELWYYLHFNFTVSDIPEDDYVNLINKKLGIVYNKNSKITEQMYGLLKEYQNRAIDNATELIKYHKEYDKNISDKENLEPYDYNPPVTTVCRLVKELNKLCKKCNKCGIYNNCRAKNCNKCGGKLP